MKPWERWSFGLLTLVVLITGAAYGWMKYFVVSEDPFAVVNHPWQMPMLNLHLVASPLFVLVFGIILNSHVMKKLRATRLPNRRTAYTSPSTFAAMVLSGYLLQVTSNEQWLQALVVLHVASGAVFAVAYGIHLMVSAQLARRQLSAIREVA